MPTIAEVRAKYPQYSDMSDDQLAEALHRKFYSDMPKAEFDAKIGLTPADPYAGAAPSGALAQDPVAQRALQEGLQKKGDEMLIGPAGSMGNNPITAAVDRGLNTFGIKIPRALAAATATGLGKMGVDGFNPSYSENYDKAQAQADALQRQNPVSSTIGAGLGIAGQVAAMPAAAPASIGGRIAAAGGMGAGMGAIESGIESKGDLGATARGAAAGGLGGLAGGALGEAIGGVVARKAARNATIDLAPTADDLGQRAAAAYKAASDAGVWYSPKAYSTFVNDVKQSLSKEGYYGKLHPNTSAIVEALDGEAGKAVTLDQLENLRRVAMAGTDTLNKSDKRLAYQVLDKLDNFARESKGVIFGNGVQGVAALQNARALWAAKSKSDRITAALQTAEQRAATTGSGANIDNATRQELRKLLKYGGRGFSKDEQKLIASAAFGSNGRNLARLIGKFSPTGAVSAGMSAVVGHSLAGPAGLALPVVGSVAKEMADRGTQNAAQYAAAMARLAQANPEAVKQIAQRSTNARLKAAALAAIAGISGGIALAPGLSQ